MLKRYIKLPAWKQIKEYCQDGRRIFLQFMSGYLRAFQRRLHNNKDYRELKRKPWYILCGSAQSGRNQLLLNSGLRLIKPDVYGRLAVNLVKQFHEFDWYFTEEAVLIGMTCDDHKDAQVCEKKFIKYLHKRRKAKPISGIIFTFSLPDLVLATHKNRREFLQSFVYQIKSLYNTLKAPIPVYTIFTKNDLIRGFSEFFSDMSKEDLAQVWGVTFPLADSSNINMINALFDHEYNQLMARLQQRVLWSLDAEKMQHDRNLIYAFPQQMQLFKKPIATFISELFALIADVSMLQLRGIYFTSALQKGEPYDFFLHAIGRRYRLKSSNRLQQEYNSEGYFIQNLFCKVILPESKLLGFSERRRRNKKWLHQSAWFIAPLSVVVSLFVYHFAFNINTKNIENTKNQLQQYHYLTNKLNQSNPSVAAILPILDTLHKILGFNQLHPWMKWLLVPSYNLYAISYDALERSLHTLLLPRVAATLEKRLRQGELDTNSLYANLKGYLAFSPGHFTDPTEIRAPMDIYWNYIYRKEPAKRIKLHDYLWQASQIGLNALPIDWKLVNAVRLQLQQVVPEKRAYALLSTAAIEDGLANINLADAVGAGFSQVFSESAQKKIIPALYSAAGYQQIFKPKLRLIAKEVARDNREIGIKNISSHAINSLHFQKIIRVDYNLNYFRRWHGNLENIKVRSFSSLKQAVSTLDLLSRNGSPLNKLLDIVNENTHNISGNYVHIDSYYKSLNEFSHSGLTHSELIKVMQSFANLRGYLIKINSSVNINKAALEAALQYMQGDTNNPIYKLKLLSNSAPMPVRAWLREIVNNSWQIILDRALIEINSIWNNSIFAEYEAHITSHYPLASQAKAQLDIDNFRQFFGPTGMVSKFFNTYLSSFIDTSESPWKLYVVNGHSLALTRHDVNIFQQIKCIQNLYFSKNSGHPNIELSIKPMLLDNAASHLELTIGSHIIDYAHGPSQPVLINWPLTDSMQQTKLSIINFSTNNAVFSSYGPWSLFKLIAQSRLYPSPAGRGYIATIKLGHYYAKFIIISNTPINAFKLNELKGFSMPSKL